MKFLYPVISTALFACASFGQTLDSILSSYESERERVLRPLDDKFDMELSKLLQKLTAAGKLDESLKVDQLLKDRIYGGPSDIIGEWKFEDDSGFLLIVREDGTARIHRVWPRDAKWVHLEGRKIELKLPNNEVSTLTIHASLKTGIYKSSRRESRVTRLK